MEIKPMELVKVQGLASMLLEGNEKALNMDKKESPKMVAIFIDELERHEWLYVDIVY